MAKKKVSNPFSSRKKKPRKKKTSKPSPLWKLEKNGITNSGLNRWMACPEQFALSYIDGWTPRKLSVPLTWGNIWHLMFQYKDTRTKAKGVTKYRNSLKDNLNTYAMQELDQIIAQVQVMFPLYLKHYKNDHQDYTFTSHESTFEVIKDIHGVKVPLRGKRDAEYKIKGSFGLWEVKTKSKIDTNLISDLLRCDFQTLLYLWSMREEYGETPCHLTYDVIKRPGLRQGKSETYLDYLNRIKYDVVKNPSNYFQRWPVTVLDSDLDTFDKKLLTPALKAFVKWDREVSKTPFLPERLDADLHYLNLSALVNPYGKSDFYDLIIKGNQAGHYQRSSPHPELD